MSRPRLDAEQKKVSFLLAFSPNLIAALEKVRGCEVVYQERLKLERESTDTDRIDDVQNG